MIGLLKSRQNTSKSLVALIDGEHYPQINRDAINLLKNTFKGRFNGIIFLGGSEKLIFENMEDFYGEKVFAIKDLDTDFLHGLDILKPDLVYDLSDEPIVNYLTRMKIASFCLVKQCSYMGPDFFFEYEPKTLGFERPSLLIIGTGKRIGKTAVSSYAAAILAKKKKVNILAMGRGGPEKPQLIKGSEIQITPQFLLDLSRKGLHASSDYIEDALFSKVDTVGCRRCGGGFGGKFFMSNIKAGVEFVEKLDPEIVIVEGSGASVPPVKTDYQICVIGADQDWTGIVGYLGLYRIITSRLIFLTMCEEPLAGKIQVDNLIDQIKKTSPEAMIVKSVFRPEPLYDVKGKKVFMVLTAKKLAENTIKHYLEKEFGCHVVKISVNLANRQILGEELSGFKDYDVLLTELKAASVDMVTDFAIKNGKEINYINNIPKITEGHEYFMDLMESLAGQ